MTGKNLADFVAYTMCASNLGNHCRTSLEYRSLGSVCVCLGEVSFFFFFLHVLVEGDGRVTGEIHGTL